MIKIVKNSFLFLFWLHDYTIWKTSSVTDFYTSDIKNAKFKTLKKYDVIYLEYYYGVQDIPFYLKKTGFDVNIKLLIKLTMQNHQEEFKNMEVSMILAKKI